jgi:hypothetical protein
VRGKFVDDCALRILGERHVFLHFGSLTLEVYQSRPPAAT